MKTKVITWVLGLIILPLILSAQLGNTSSRNEVQPGKRLMVGFVVTTPGKYLIRAVGPGLVQFGVQNTMVDPYLEIYSGQRILAGNDDWHVGPGVETLGPTYLNLQAKAGAFPLPAGSYDSAYVIDLIPGAYTAQVFDQNGGGGDVLVEVYEIPNE